jgi:hypothetical protein
MWTFVESKKLCLGGPVKSLWCFKSWGDYSDVPLISAWLQHASRPVLLSSNIQLEGNSCFSSLIVQEFYARRAVFDQICIFVAATVGASKLTPQLSH